MKKTWRGIKMISVKYYNKYILTSVIKDNPFITDTLIFIDSFDDFFTSIAESIKKN